MLAPGAPGLASPAVTTAPDSASAHPRWALVLSGGSGRGLAHVGVLRALEEEGLVPDAVFGTSMGSAVGALYASGRSSASIQRSLRAIDWDEAFGTTERTFGWRNVVQPRPWLTFESHGTELHFPPGLIEPANLEYQLTRLMLDAEARAGGDFDRLPIPFRAVASDLNTLEAVTLAEGSVAEAVRASIGIPVLFPPIELGGRVLVDGGSVANLPIAPAREAGFDHLLAIDVTPPQTRLTDRSSALTIGLTLIDRLNRRGQVGRLRAGEQSIHLKLAGFSSADFSATDRISDAAYLECRAAIRTFADSLRAAGVIPRGRAPGDSTFRLPPARPVASWLDSSGQPARGAHAAGRLFGDLPADSFAAATIAPGLMRVYRGDLYASVWPGFRVRDDSTDVSFVTRPNAAAELALAAGYETDRKGRVIATLTLRTATSLLPRRIVVGGSARNLGWRVFAAGSPYALLRGGPSTFVRASVGETQTRIFTGEDRWTEESTHRFEGFAGVQKPLGQGTVVQVGAGIVQFEGGDASSTGGAAAIVIDGTGRFTRHLDAIAVAGATRYGAVNLLAALDLPTRPCTVRPLVSFGLAADQAPLDELPALGGPGSLGGLRAGEWLGRRAFGAELRILRELGGGLEMHVAGQVGRVDQAVGRADFAARPRFAGVVGFRARVPFGPIGLDAGLTEGGQSRIDFALGPNF